MAKNDERDEHETGEAEQTFGRRTLLTGSAAVAGAGLLAAGATSVVPHRDAIAATGEKRKLIWVVHEIGVWNLPLDVAFHDVAKMTGWEFQKVASQPAFTVEGMTKDITTAIQAKPDVLIVTMPGDGIVPILKEAQASVDYLAIHHAFNETLVLEEIPDYLAGFAGEIPAISGGTVAQGVLDALHENGRTSGVIGLGNPVPGHEFVGKRVTGMKDTVAAFNEANGTTFEAEEFDDKSLDLAAAVPIYKTYIRRHGDDLAGFFGLGNFPTVAIIQAMKELGIGPGEFPLATIDTATVTNEGVKEGYVMFIYDNQYYTQSFIPAMQAWQFLERGFKALDRYPTGAIVNKDNIDSVIARDDALLELGKEYGIAY